MKLVLCTTRERRLLHLMWPSDRVIAIGEGTRADEVYDDMIITTSAGQWINRHHAYYAWFTRHIQPRLHASSSPTD